MSFSGKCNLKYFKTLDVYKSSTGNCLVDLKTGIATSYKWWNFSMLHPKKKNTILFNNSTYSNTTSGHQGAASRLFEEMGFKVEYCYIGTSQMSWENYINVTLKNNIDSIVTNHVLINRKGSRKETNEVRLNDIQSSVKELEYLVTLGCIIDLNDIETKVNTALSEDLNRVPTNNDRVVDKSLMVSAKNEMNNFDEVVLLTQNVNNLDEVTL